MQPVIVSVVAILVAAFGWWDAPRSAERVLRRLIRRGAAPPSDEITRRVLDRLRRRNRATMVGMVAGVLVGVALVIVAADVNMAWIWLAALDLAGAGAGAIVVHVVDSGRTAAEPGTRAAVLRPRRLRDFLLPAEIAAPYLALALPLLTTAFAVASGVGQAASLGNWLVFCVAGAITGILVATLAQRFVLHMAPPADSVERVRWEDVMRAIALRDIGVMTYGVLLVLGLATLSITTGDATIGYPWVLLVTAALGLLGVAGLVVLSVVAEVVAPPVRLADRLYGDPSTVEGHR